MPQQGNSRASYGFARWYPRRSAIGLSLRASTASKQNLPVRVIAAWSMWTFATNPNMSLTKHSWPIAVKRAEPACQMQRGPSIYNPYSPYPAWSRLPRWISQSVSFYIVTSHRTRSPWKLSWPCPKLSHKSNQVVLFVARYRLLDSQCLRTPEMIRIWWPRLGGNIQLPCDWRIPPLDVRTTVYKTQHSVQSWC